ncbi:hypothetical protein ACH5RR_020713 [Cinchona calisaya]|uniref:Uncharacterized protein n=1 Tax=Cinchona calisaya TaxID=153742 RepID=A0ABD2ZGD3_9GENT
MEVYCDHNMEKEINEIIQKLPLVRQKYDKSIPGVLIEEIDSNGDIVRLKSIDRFSDDGEFYNDEHMLEDLIVDLESNGGAYAGVDNLAQQPAEVDAIHELVAVDDILQKPVRDDAYSQQIIGGEKSSQQPVRANESSQQHNSHQYQHQPQQLSRRKEVLEGKENPQGLSTPMLQLRSILHSKGFSIVVAHSEFRPPNPKNHPEFIFHPLSDNLSRFQATIRNLLDLISV